LGQRSFDYDQVTSSMVIPTTSFDDDSTIKLGYHSSLHHCNQIRFLDFVVAGVMAISFEAATTNLD